MDIIKKAELSQQKEIELLRQDKANTEYLDQPFEMLTSKNSWPAPMRDEAFYGLAGTIVKTIEPHSEADIVSLLINFLTAFGNIIGSKPHFKVEGDKHSLRLFCALVGQTSKARKGTSWGHIRNIFQTIDPDWNIMSGLSSGEGLIWAVRDQIDKGENGDEGVSDKRTLLVESEFASILRVLSRDGNTLSAILRNAWDSGNLQSLTKNSPAKATNAHISILGHVTKEELVQYLSATEKANGFGNRFLWFCVKRSKSLPFGGQINVLDNIPLMDDLCNVIDFAASVENIQWAEETRALWEYIYPPLSEGKTGLLGSMISRAEAHVVRLACMYAILDKSILIEPNHLKAALAVWDYSENSARYIFEDRTGNELADEISNTLALHSDGLSKTEISKQFNNHKSSLELTEALDTLQGLGIVHREIESTDGRDREVWYLTDSNTHNSLNSQTKDTYLEKLESFINKQVDTPL